MDSEGSVEGTAGTLDFLTTKEKRSIVQTWRRIAVNKTEFGQRVYQQIFTLRPELQQLYPFAGDPLEKLPENRTFARQAATFAHFLQVRRK